MNIEDSVTTYAGDLLFPTKRIKNDQIRETHEEIDLHFTEEI